MTDYTSLIAELESATGPSRELDARIAIAISDIDMEPGVVHGTLRIPGAGSVPAETIAARCYTESIDAALTLVPEGYSKHLNEGDHIGGASAWCCPSGGDSYGVSDPRTGQTEMPAPTMAIALCIAALKARQSTNT